MSKQDEEKVFVALSVISGRKSCDDLSLDDCETLGYNTYSFRAFGKPSQDNILAHCEHIIAKAIFAAKRGDDEAA